MFCIKVSLYRLAVVPKCYRDSLMECEKFTFKKTGNPRLQVGGNGHCCEQYWLKHCIQSEDCYAILGFEQRNTGVEALCKQSIIQYV